MPDLYKNPFVMMHLLPAESHPFLGTHKIFGGKNHSVSSNYYFRGNNVLTYPGSTVQHVQIGNGGDSVLKQLAQPLLP